MKMNVMTIMNRFLPVFFAAAACCFSQQLCADAPQAGALPWTTNYEEAAKQAKTNSKPMILFFTGSDWCGWCHKLEDEVLNTSEFIEAAGNKYVFVMLDFPTPNNPIDPKVAAQNKLLKEKYAIRGFPTIIILDSNEKQIGNIGYEPGGPKKYAETLDRKVNDFSNYQSKMGAADKKQFSGNELKQLYEKANELGLYNDANKIIALGEASDQKPFFLVERYRFLVGDGRIHDRETRALREKLLSLDPRNENRIPYQVAVIDFEAYCEEMEKEHYSAELAVAPLLSYIKQFGSIDKENLWRLQTIISQVYLDKNDVKAALKFAEESYKVAPPSVQPEIAIAIQNIQKKTTR